MSIAENALPPRTLLNFESLYSEEMYRLQWVRMGKCSVITALCSFLTAVCTLAGSYLQLKSPAQDSGFSDGVSEMGGGRWAGWRDGRWAKREGSSYDGRGGRSCGRSREGRSREGASARRAERRDGGPRCLGGAAVGRYQAVFPGRNTLPFVLATSDYLYGACLPCGHGGPGSANEGRQGELPAARMVCP